MTYDLRFSGTLAVSDMVMYKTCPGSNQTELCTEEVGVRAHP